jgi:hypothetical protein
MPQGKGSGGRALGELRDFVDPDVRFPRAAEEEEGEPEESFHEASMMEQGD